MLNRVVLMGRLTADPDYRTTQNGTAMAEFTLAVERDFSGPNNERQTDFLDVVVWRQRADFVSKYFHKGQLVAVQGSIQTSSYTDREGNKRKAWDVIADQVYFAEGSRSSNPQQAQPLQPSTADNTSPAYGSFDEYGHNYYDDLPF